MDWNSAKTIVFISIGNAIGGAIVAAFYNWKANRAEVRMVRNKRGQYVDIADVYERRAKIGLAIFFIGGVAASTATFLTIP